MLAEEVATRGAAGPKGRRRVPTSHDAGAASGEARIGPLDRLWVRGGFPDSFLAPDDEASYHWRIAFIQTSLERDIPALGPRIPAQTLRRFWTMLAHEQGGRLIAAAPEGWQAWFYRTSAGAEIDLVIEGRSGERWAIEVKRSSAPAASKRFRSGSDDIRATRRLVVYPGEAAVPLGGDVEAVGLLEAARRLRTSGPPGG